MVHDEKRRKERYEVEASNQERYSKLSRLVESLKQVVSGGDDTLEVRGKPEVKEFARNFVDVLSKNLTERAEEPKLIESLFQRFARAHAFDPKNAVIQIQEYYKVASTSHNFRYSENIVAATLEEFGLYGTEDDRVLSIQKKEGHKGSTALVRIRNDDLGSMNQLRAERSADRGRRVSQIAYPLFDKLASVEVDSDKFEKAFQVKLTPKEKKHLEALAHYVGISFKQKLGKSLSEVTVATRSVDSLSPRERRDFIEDNIERLVTLTRSQEDALEALIGDRKGNEKKSVIQSYLMDLWDAIGVDMDGDTPGSGLRRQDALIQKHFHNAYIEKLDGLDRALNGLAGNAGKWELINEETGGVRYYKLLKHLYEYMQSQLVGLDLDRGSNFIKTVSGYLGVRIPGTVVGLEDAIAKVKTQVAEDGEVRVEAADEPETSPQLLKELKGLRQSAFSHRRNFSDTFGNYLVPFFNMSDKEGFMYTDEMIAVFYKSALALQKTSMELPVKIDRLEKIRVSQKDPQTPSEHRLNAQGRDDLYTAEGTLRDLEKDVKRVCRVLEALLGRPDIAPRLRPVIEKYKKTSRDELMKSAILQGEGVELLEDTLEARVYEFQRRAALLENAWEVARDEHSPAKSEHYVAPKKIGWKTHVQPFLEKVDTLVSKAQDVRGIEDLDARSKAEVAVKQRFAELESELKELEHVHELLALLEAKLRMEFPTKRGGIGPEGIEILKRLFVENPGDSQRIRPVSEIVKILEANGVGKV